LYLWEIADPQISSVNIPKKIYRIHIKDLPSDATAEILSKKFNWPIFDILMDSSLDNESLPVECWLKDVNDLETAQHFVQDWNGRMISGLKIACEVEEDKLELCKEFRLGKCTKASNKCDWLHIMCTLNAKCSKDCPFGHTVGIKTGYINDRELYF
jgi:hypothetical protein